MSVPFISQQSRWRIEQMMDANTEVDDINHIKS